MSIPSRARIELGEAHRFEGVMVTGFTGETIKLAKRGDGLFGTPRIAGHAYITGYPQFVLKTEGNAPRCMDEAWR